MRETLSSSAPASREARLLAHLLIHARSRKDLVAPHWTTQAGISARTQIARPNVARVLAVLESRGLVEWRVGPVEGEARYKKVYFLTDAGVEHARRVGAAPSGHMVYPTTLAWPRLFVGRDAELAALSRWARGSGPTVLAVHGMAGIGKTTLVLRAIEDARRSASAFYVRVTPWLTASGLLGELSAFLSLLDRRSLASLLSHPRSSAEPVDVGGAAFSTRRDLEGLRALLAFDDYHEATPEVEHAVCAIADALAGGDARVLLAGRSLRPPADVRAARTGLAVEIALGGLAAEALAKIVAQRLPAARDPATLERLHAATGGNPLLAQLLNDPADISRPGEVRDYLRKEFHDMLSPGERAILARMSVYRGDIPPGAVEGAADSPALSTLISKGLVSREPRSGAYSVHEALRELYRASSDRRTMEEGHAAAARHYAGAGDPGSLAERAWHLAGAGLHEEIATLLETEGERLLAAGRPRELLAAAEASPGATSSAVRALRGRALAALGELRAAEEALRGAEDGAAAETRAYCLRLMGDFAAAEDALRTALASARKRSTRPDPGLVLRLERELGVLMAARADARSLGLLRRCLVRARRSRDPSAVADCERALGTALVRMERERDGVGHIERAASIYRRTGETRPLGIAMNNVSAALLAEGDLAGALAAAAETMKAAEACGDRTILASAYINAGLVKIEREQRSEAAEYAAKARALAVAVSSNRLGAMACALGAESALRSGDPGAAAPMLEEAVALGSGGDDVVVRCWVLRKLALLSRMRGDQRDCDAKIEESKRIARAAGIQGQIVLAELALAEAEVDSGRAREAAVRVGRVLGSRLRGSVDAVDMARLLEVRGIALTTTGRRKAGEKDLRAAARHYERIGAPWAAQRCLACATGGRRPRKPAGEGRGRARAAYLIHESGAVVAEWVSHGGGQKEAPGAREMLGEVLMVLQAMVRETMGLPSGDSLSALSFGGITVLLEPGPKCSLVAEFEGGEPPGAREAMRAVMARIVREHGAKIARWGGDLAELAHLGPALGLLGDLPQQSPAR